MNGRFKRPWRSAKRNVAGLGNAGRNVIDCSHGCDVGVLTSGKEPNIDALRQTLRGYEPSCRCNARRRLVKTVQKSGPERADPSERAIAWIIEWTWRDRARLRLGSFSATTLPS